MKVLVMTVAHPPLDARIHNRQVRSLLARGHEVTYLAPWTAFGVQPPADLRAVDVPRSVGRHRLGPVLAAARLGRRLAPGHDVVLGHDPELVPVLLDLARRGPAVVWDVHEDVPKQVDAVPWIPPRAKRPAAAVLRAVEAVAERRLHLTLAGDTWTHRYRGRHPVVLNSPRVPATPPPGPRREPGEPWRVVHVGALTRARGIEELLQLVELLPQDVRLELIGNAAPDLDARLRAVDDPRLDYRGFVPNAQAVQRLDGALAGLVLLRDHENYREAQPSKVMEYFGHGVPTITTALPAAARMVREARAGSVVEHGDVAGVLAAVLALRDDPALQRAQSAAGYRAARERYDWNAQGEAFVDVLEGWAARSARR